MPKFRVLRRVDAYVDYVAEVEAEHVVEAAELARDDPDKYEWEELGAVEFDARGYVTLNGDGDEIDKTRCGDF
ncbi:MAG TPA: hypothetical protein VGS12_05755 [Caulobacteraceae bacterium]|nr:hypothetical protein [Caulobacteraceae bacterium]